LALIFIFAALPGKGWGQIPEVNFPIEAKIMNPDSLKNIPTEPIQKEVVYSTTDAFTFQPEELMLKSQPQRTAEGPLDGDNRVQENTKFLHSEWSEKGLFHPYKPSDEVTQLRTEHSKTFKNSDGSFTALMLSDIHYLNENNEWKEIDSRLIKDVDNTNTAYDLVNTTNRFQTSFTSNNAVQGYSVTKNKVTAKFGYGVTMDIVDDAGTVIQSLNRTNNSNSTLIDDRIVRYSNAFSGGIDEEFVTLKRGVEHGFLLNNPTSFSAYAGNKIRISEKIELPQGAIVLFNNDKVVQGVVTTKDFTIQLSDGSVYAKYLPVVIYDGSVSYKEILMLAETPSSYFETQYDKEGRVIDRSSIFITSDYTLQLIGNELVVSYNVPANWLLDASRTFPVYVDPTVDFFPLTTLDWDNYGNPYNTYYHDSRFQSLVLGSELDAVGVVNNSTISRIDFYVRWQPGRDVTNFRVRLRNTTNTTSTSFVTSGWSTVVGPVNAGRPSNGTWQNHNSTPFTRNNNNLLIDISRDNGGYTCCGGMRVRQTATNRGISGFSDSGTPWPFDAIANQAASPYVPHMRITYTVPCPTGLLQSNTITANGSTSPITVCTGVPITIASSGGEAGSGWYYWATSNGYASWDILNGANQNQSSFTFTPTTPGTYYFHVYNYDICGFWCWSAERGANCSLSSYVQVNVGSPAAPGFGINSWNVLGYEHGGYNYANIGSLAGNTFKGYYTDATVDINSQARWNSDNSPSSASGWNGCSVTNDLHTTVYKRQGFPSAFYQIDLNGHDDGVQCYVNGNLVYQIDGCCTDRGVIWQGALCSTSTVEFRVMEGGGGSNLNVDFRESTWNVDAGTDVTICSGTPTTLAGISNSAGSFNTTPNIGIQDNTSITSTLVVSGTSLSANQLFGVSINANHTYTGDLSFTLIAPNGTSIDLSSNNGGSANNYSNTYFATTGPSITSGSAPFNGSYTPEVAFSNLTGSANGTWTLVVNDNASGDQGTLLNWGIIFNSINTGTYAWTSNPNGFSSSLLTPSVSPSVTTTYTLTATSSGCSVSDNVLVTVNQPSVAPTSISGTTTICNGSSTMLTANGTLGTGAVYQWGTGSTVGTNAISGSTATITVSPTTTTTYWVRIINTTSPCTATTNGVTSTVTVTPATVAPTFTAGATTICANGTDTYIATTPQGTVSYSIIGGTGASIDPTSGVLSSAGTTNFTVRATSSNGVCSSLTTDRAVTVTPATVAPTFTAGATTICANGTDTYTATTTQGTISYSIIGGTGASINPTSGVLSSAGTTNFTVRATSSNGVCSSLTTDRAVTVTPATVAPTFTAGATTICANATDTYIATTPQGTVSYSIIGGTGASINPTSGVLSSAGTTNFIVRATSSNGVCSSLNTDRAVTVNPSPTVLSLTGSSVCSGLGTIASSTSQSGVTYQLYNSSNTAVGSALAGTGNGLTWSSVAAGTGYYVIATNAITFCNSDASNAVGISINPTPTVTATASSISPCVGQSVTLTAGGATSYSWSNGVNTAAQTLIPAATTTYTVTGTSNGCSGTAEVTVTLPTAGSTLAETGESATCAVNQIGWIHFYHSSGRLIGSINSQGQNLGNVTMTSFVDGTNALIPACINPSSSTSTSVLQRHWVITPSIQPTSPVLVRLPHTLTEFNSLSSAASTNPNSNDDILSPQDLDLTKYSNGSEANVNSSALDNCGVGTSTFHQQTQYDNTNTYSAVQDKFAEFSISSFSEFWLHGSATSSPLPVELISFQANCAEDGKVEVTWSTSSEHNSADFTLEKSRDGNNWSVLATLAGAGNSTQVINYSVADNTAAEGINYYRLTQTDFDGASETFNIASANCSESDVLNTINVYPNPSTGDFYIVFTSVDLSGTSVITITDARGSEIYTQSVMVEKGSNVFHIENMEAAPGIYYIKVSNGTATSNIVKHSLR
jgi:subtilisin-like proprotein convertase family protein